MERAYPSHWEADVVLSDGVTAHLRPITADDADRLVAFYDRVSDESKYFRFFAPYPKLSDRDIARFTDVDHDERVGLIVLAGEDMIAVGRYDRVDATSAEVAFLVEDAHQGRGLGSVLLEHLAAAAGERGVRRFVAEVLPANRKMLTVFQDAGYQVSHAFEEGVVSLTFDISPTEHSLEVMSSREHRAEARSVERLLRPRSIVVVGASRTYATVGQTLLRHVVDSGFTGPVYAVNPGADKVAGVPAYARVADVPGEVDLAILAVSADQVAAVLADCAGKQVRGVVVVSAGFAETGSQGRAAQQELVRTARSHGMRVVGPNSFGFINTDPAVQLNASLAPDLPPQGRIGFFSQSGALGIAILQSVAARGMGLSTFVSAGNRADVSGNDLLQYWEEDPNTDVVMLYLESFGNPRKFARLARRLARRKPVVVVKSGRSAHGIPVGHTVRASQAPVAAMDALFRQAGVIRTENIHQLFDVAALLDTQPLPSGDRVAILGNSDALGALAFDACESWGLPVVGEPVSLRPEATAEEFRSALAAVFDDPTVDSVVAVFIPPLLTQDEEVAAVLAAAASKGTKTVVSTFLGMRGVPEQLRAGSERAGSVPSYPTPEEAVRALAAATRYAEWRRRPAGIVPELDVDSAAAHGLVEEVLTQTPAGRALQRSEVSRLLNPYGLSCWPSTSVSSLSEALEAAEEMGYPVALKATTARLRHRVDLGAIRLDLSDADELRHAYAQVEAVSGAEDPGLVVQRMAPHGLTVVIGSAEDPLLGPIVSFGVGGVATDLLGDTAYRIPPLTDLDAAEMVQSVRAAPLLFGHRGSDPLDVAAVEHLILQVSRLADDVPEISKLELNPVVVCQKGLAVLGAEVHLAPPSVRTDTLRRSLPS